MAEKLNILKHSRRVVMRQPLQTIMTSTGHNIKWDHFEILTTGRSNIHFRIKETLLNKDLKAALNENVGSGSKSRVRLGGGNSDLPHVTSVGEVVIARAHVTVLPRLRDAETRRVAGGWGVVQLIL